MIMIHPGAEMRGGVRQDPSAMQTLKLDDFKSLQDETNFLSAVQSERIIFRSIDKRSKQLSIIRNRSQPRISRNTATLHRKRNNVHKR